MAGIEVQEPLPGMTRSDLGGESIIHLFTPGYPNAACCGITFFELTSDDGITDAEELLTCGRDAGGL